MIITPILPAIQADIANQGFFALKNFAGLPVEMFEEMARKELLEINTDIYVQSTNQGLLNNDNLKNFEVYLVQAA